LLEDAAERLLGDLEHVEQFGDLHAGIAIDEMQHAMMGAAEVELLQHLVGVADEIAIGEEQQFDQIEIGLGGLEGRLRYRSLRRVRRSGLLRIFDRRGGGTGCAHDGDISHAI